MSLVADAFQPRIVSKLFHIGGRSSHCHVPDALVSPKAAYDLDFDVQNKSISVEFRDADFIGGIMCGDACRFASAAFTTAKKIEDKFVDLDDFPWAIIKMYYSAFYAAHSTIRLLGTSCSFLYANHTLKLKGIGTLAGQAMPFQINTGLYKCSLSENQTGLIMTVAAGRVGGAHEAFWYLYDQYLSVFTEDVLMGQLSTQDSQIFFPK